MKDNSALDTYNGIAPYYDFLATTVFGNSIRKSQIENLSFVADNDSVLIIGGGTGWILPEIIRLRPTVRVWYVEASSRMIAIAKKNIPGVSNVVFIHGDTRRIPADISFDVVICNFFFDQFSPEEVSSTSATVSKRLKEGGVLLVSDFVESKWWHTVLLRFMYWFFRITVGLNTRELPPWAYLIRKAGFEVLGSRTFFGGFIESLAFKKGGQA